MRMSSFYNGMGLSHPHTTEEKISFFLPYQIFPAWNKYLFIYKLVLIYYNLMNLLYKLIPEDSQNSISQGEI
jgi:hypothetical protein